MLLNLFLILLFVFKTLAKEFIEEVHLENLESFIDSKQTEFLKEGVIYTNFNGIYFLYEYFKFRFLWR